MVVRVDDDEAPALGSVDADEEPGVRFLVDQGVRGRIVPDAMAIDP